MTRLQSRSTTFAYLPVLLTLFTGFAVVTAGQERRRGEGPGYDVTTERTIKATASRTYALPVGPDRQMSVLAVTAEGGTLHVVLAPPDYVQKQAFAVKPGEAVEVTGVTGLQVNGEPAMMARLVKAGGKTLMLRSETGQPLWGG